MQPTLSNETTENITGVLRPAMTAFTNRYPGETGHRQPVHTVYGGAHLFKADTAVRLGQLAERAFRANATDAEEFGRVLDIPGSIRQDVFDRVVEKLGREAVEDFRIDFEDGYGTRPDDE
ncbi:MAG TPA: hypothetical protein VGO43_16280, partial [Pyrinomonadaceae bacterium]|nr:hypothetical protein [Pyrinomonadaceae bacterium]